MPQGEIPSLVTSSVVAGHRMSIDDTGSDIPTLFSCGKCGAVADYNPNTGSVTGPAVTGGCTS